MRWHVPRIQRPYYRNGPDHRAGADVSFADIVKIFQFRGIKLGRWVTPEETQLAANLFFDAFCDLQTMLGLPPSAISLQGRLSLAFGRGGQQGVCAFYQPQGRVLALAKNAGGGALAHEWFHAFDHHIARHLYPEAPAHAFASHYYLTDAQARQHPLNEPLLLLLQLALLSPERVQPSALFQRSVQADQQLQQAYFSKPPEVLARCFEQVLAQHPLRNHFLVSGLSAGAALGVYPTEQESQQLAIPLYHYFHNLGRALTNQDVS